MLPFADVVQDWTVPGVGGAVLIGIVGVGRWAGSRFEAVSKWAATRFEAMIADQRAHEQRTNDSLVGLIRESIEAKSRLAQVGENQLRVAEQQTVAINELRQALTHTKEVPRGVIRKADTGG